MLTFSGLLKTFVIVSSCLSLNGGLYRNKVPQTEGNVKFFRLFLDRSQEQIAERWFVPREKEGVRCKNQDF